MLDITVHQGNAPLSLVGGVGGRGLTRVCQWSIDIESWLFDQLEEIVAATGEGGPDGEYSLHSISDYDLRILEASKPHPVATPSSYSSCHTPS